LPSQKLTAGNLLRSFQYAINGIVYFFRNERNAKAHLIIASVVIIFSFLLQINSIEWAITLLGLKSIFTQEMSNSVRKDILSDLHPEFSEMAKLAKDKSAGGVLMAGLFFLAIEIIILGPKIVVLILN